EISHLRRVGVRKINDGYLAGLGQIGIVDGWSLRIIEKPESIYSPQPPEQRQPTQFVTCFYLSRPLLDPLQVIPEDWIEGLGVSLVFANFVTDDAHDVQQVR